MPELVQLVKWELEAFLVLLGAIVAFQLLTGRIKTSGLFRGQISGRPVGQNQYFSPERVQLLIFTLGAALYYLSQVINNPNPGTFPEVPASWPAILGGSHAIYLGGKSYARWFANGKK
jgi:hypothetical protein